MTQTFNEDVVFDQGVKVGGNQEHRQRPRTLPNRDTCDLVFDYICAYLEQQGYPPSIRNIGRACQLSIGGVVYNLGKLEDRGWLTRAPKIARSLRVLWMKPPRPEKSEQT
jgi:SOS-response transcriptional repressor LexA